VARLLGAETLATGIAATETLIEIPGGLRLSVSGPPLRPGSRIGWSVRPDRLRLVEAGGYPGTILAVGQPIAGRQTLRFRLGEVVLGVTQAADGIPAPGPARLAIPPSALQIWPAEAEDAGQAAAAGLGFTRHPEGVAP
jgi:hypothetical protein